MFALAFLLLVPAVAIEWHATAASNKHDGIHSVHVRREEMRPRHAASFDHAARLIQNPESPADQIMAAATEEKNVIEANSKPGAAVVKPNDLDEAQTEVE